MIAGEEASSTMGQQMTSQTPLRKSQREGISTEEVSTVDESAQFWKKRCRQGHLVIRRRSKDQDLRQEGTV